MSTSLKAISFSASGNRADIGAMEIYRILPNRFAQAVGHFVFLDHLAPKVHTQNLKGSTGAHPHRGIATLTYVLQGMARHRDSAGHQAEVRSGGVQWMKAGNGIVHDEALSHDPDSAEKITHGFQFWINLPSPVKKEKPDYRAVQAGDVPTLNLPDGAGTLRVLLGEFEENRSPIPTFARIFLYHIQLNGGQSFRLPFEADDEVAAFLPVESLGLNDTAFDGGEFVEFDRKAGEVMIQNPHTTSADILLFGGEPYTEPIVAEGPFVMNTKAEIAEAYRDYFAGKYGLPPED